MVDRPIVFDAIIGDQASCPEVSTAELQAALNTASAVVLDARPFEEYAVSHIPGARTIPGKPGTTPALYVAAQSRAVGEAIVHDAFHNVSFFDGAVAELDVLWVTSSTPSPRDL